uniref:Uncharacterized protein n=1 Tax=Chaetoceros debilis TaxID=122233 RepID=A0A7S3QEF2_9STRA|mmetsp:Transcript_12897/g.19340  ORF Transcript_12897/g.19340 Transcript_12897/m.19340 type:complete len:932 (+) Transcript_12897:234-3029(+)
MRFHPSSSSLLLLGVSSLTTIPFLHAKPMLLLDTKDVGPYEPRDNYGFQSGGFDATTSSMMNLNEQKTDASNSFGHSLHYDAESKLVYVTGSTYWSYWDRIRHSPSQVTALAELDHSDCFFAVLEVPGKDPNTDINTSQDMKLVYTRRMGRHDYDESCSTQAFHKSSMLDTVANDSGDSQGPGYGGTNKIIQAGRTKEAGLLTNFRGLGTPVSSMYGFILSFDLDVIEEEFDKAEVTEKEHGARLMNNHAVQYPAGIATNPVPNRNDGAIYVVSLVSAFPTKSDDIDELEVNADDDEASSNMIIGDQADLDYLAGGANSIRRPEFGQHYGISVEKIVPKTKEEMEFEMAEAEYLSSGGGDDVDRIDEGGAKDNLKTEWSEYFTPKLDIAGLNLEHYLRLADMIYMPRFVDVREDQLVIVGTTTGFGNIFGDVDMNPDFDDTDGNEEVSLFKDGFVAKLDLDGGMVDRNTRISTGIHDVNINGVCIDVTENHSVRHIYVVGSTKGQLDLEMKDHDLSRTNGGKIATHAFISKLDAETLDVLWSRQLGGVNGKDVEAYGCAVTPQGDNVYMAGNVADGDNLRIPSMSASAATLSMGGQDIFVVNYSTEKGDAQYVQQFGTKNSDSLAKKRGIVTDEDGNAIVLGNTNGSMMRYREEVEDRSRLSAGIHATDVFIISIDRSTGGMKRTSEVSGPPEIIEDTGNTFGFTDGVKKLVATDYFFLILGGWMLFFCFAYIIYRYCKEKNGDKINNEKNMEYLEDFNDTDYDLHLRNSASGGLHGVYGDRYPEFTPASRPPNHNSSVTVTVTDEHQNHISGENQENAKPKAVDLLSDSFTNIDTFETNPLPPQLTTTTNTTAPPQAMFSNSSKVSAATRAMFEDVNNESGSNQVLLRQESIASASSRPSTSNTNAGLSIEPSIAESMDSDEFSYAGDIL